MTIEICQHCGESIRPEEDRPIPVINAEGIFTAHRHWQCALRAVIGGVNHLLGLCTCCGGTEPPDPVGMTPRAAAVAAVELWNKRNKGKSK